MYVYVHTHTHTSNKDTAQNEVYVGGKNLGGGERGGRGGREGGERRENQRVWGLGFSSAKGLKILKRKNIYKKSKSLRFRV